MSFTSPKPQVKQVEKRPGCIHAALKILGDKWSPLLVGQLVTEARTFGDLETQLAGISPRTLSSRLDSLQNQGIIIRKQYNRHPPRYTYELTEKGKSLTDILSSMAEWGEKYSD